jgi:hypothetical protein
MRKKLMQLLKEYSKTAGIKILLRYLHTTKIKGNLGSILLAMHL